LNIAWKWQFLSNYIQNAQKQILIQKRQRLSITRAIRGKRGKSENSGAMNLESVSSAGFKPMSIQGNDDPNEKNKQIHAALEKKELSNSIIADLSKNTKTLEKDFQSSGGKIEMKGKSVEINTAKSTWVNKFVDKTKSAYGSVKKFFSSLYSKMKTKFKQFSRNLKKPENKDLYSEANSFFGYSLAAGNFGNGIITILAGAPLYSEGSISEMGAVFQADYKGLPGKKGLFQVSSSKPVLKGEPRNGRFGWAMTVADLNHDGVDDLIVSSPTIGNEGPSKLEEKYARTYLGKVSVYFGRKGAGIPSVPDIEITGNPEDKFMNFGSFLATGDCNNDGFYDLLIGSPYASEDGQFKGQVAVFLSLQGKKKVSVTDADFLAKGTESYSLLGFSADCGNNFVFVGSPGWRNNNPSTQSIGSVAIFDLKTKKQVHQINADQIIGNFGAAIEYDPITQMLIVGAPSMTVDGILYCGAVYTYSLIGKAPAFNEYQAMISGKKRGSRFGKSILMVDKTLIVGAPLYSTSDLITYGNVEAGVVFIFADPANLKGKKDEFAAVASISDSKAMRLGKNLYKIGDELMMSASFTRQDKLLFRGGLLFKDKISNLIPKNEPKKKKFSFRI